MKTEKNQDVNRCRTESSKKSLLDEIQKRCRSLDMHLAHRELSSFGWCNQLVRELKQLKALLARIS